MKYKISIVFVISAYTIFAQSSKKMVEPFSVTNQSRYKIDYELKDYSFQNIDSSILNHIDLDSLENLRHETTDIEINLGTPNVFLILYSREKVIFKMNQLGIYETN